MPLAVADYLNILDEWTAYRMFKDAEAAIMTTTDVINTDMVTEIKRLMVWDRQKEAREQERKVPRRLTAVICQDIKKPNASIVELIRDRIITTPTREATITFPTRNDFSLAFQTPEKLEESGLWIQRVFEQLHFEGAELPAGLCND